MNKVKLLTLLTATMTLSLASCDKDDETPPTPPPGSTPTPVNGNLNLNITGLPDLGENYAYEGWIIVNGAPVTAGIFNVDANGNLTQSSFELDQSDVDAATAYALTIEPSPDNDPAPSPVHILAGDFSGNTSTLTVEHPLAIGQDFTTSTATYLLGTPTDGSLMTDELSGIWWEDLTTTPPSTGLDLPTLPAGWQYEGWVVINGIPLTTGKFLEMDQVDLSAPYSGSSAGPPFPGEDFIINAPAGLSFPLDLSGMTTAISIEPFPDNSPEPFSLKPLVHTIPSPADFHTQYSMTNNAQATNPSGTVSK